MPVSVYVAGIGAVGSALLRQFDVHAGRGLRLVGVCTSRRTAWNPAGLAPRRVRARLADGDPLDWPALLDRLAQASRPFIFVDATGSAEVATVYERLFREGIHVVTTNKIPNAQSQASLHRLQTLAAEHGVQYCYETTVGAGLPIVQTIKDLVETGDRVRTIRGAVSGTLTFLFRALRAGASFSTVVRSAVDRGYAEPDVRVDLSGEDVARKFLILARTAGYSLERADVQVESLVPESFADRPPGEFLDQLDAMDAHWQRRSRAAARDGAALQYMGRLSEGTVDVGVRRVPKEGAFGGLGGQDNLFEIVTKRYAESPLVIRGPGAGPDVTAAGVLAGIRRVAHTVGEWPG